MPKPSPKALRQLSKDLEIETHFLVACLEASAVEISVSKRRIALGNGTALRLRRLQRICVTFNVELPIALILSDYRTSLRQNLEQ